MLAKLILRMTGSKSRIIHKSLPVDDPKVRCPIFTLANINFAGRRKSAWKKAWDAQNNYFNQVLKVMPDNASPPFLSVVVRFITKKKWSWKRLAVSKRIFRSKNIPGKFFVSDGSKDKTGLLDGALVGRKHANVVF